MTHQHPQRQIFIHDQQLWRLSASGNDTLEWLKPERFRLAGVPDDELRIVNVRRNPWESAIHQTILNDLKQGGLQRLCVTTNAGIGKSTFLKWLNWQLSLPASRLVPFRLELRQLPRNYGDVPDLLDSFPRVEIGDQNMQRRNASLKRVLQQKRVCLLVDSLDQTSRQLDQQIQTLGKFLKQDFAACPVVVAGRPHAITHFWKDLFEGTSWQMLQPGLFSEDQVQRYLGPEKSQRLRRLGVNIRQNPRAISVIAQMNKSRLEELRTEADVYWEMLDEQLQKALDVGALKRLERGHVEFLYCLIAFSLLRNGNRAEVTPGDYLPFLQQLFVEREDSIRAALGRPSLDKEQFPEVIFELLCINDILEHGGFERHNRPQLTEARLAFQNPSQFEFLAAMWLTKWASDFDRQWLRDHLPQKSDKQPEAINNVWRHLTEMPEAVRTGSECCWLQSIEPLFQPVLKGRHPRPTAWMYRCWRLLLAYANPDWVEVSVKIPPLQTVRNTDDRFTPIQQTARRILENFRRKSPQAARVHASTAFAWCPPQAKHGPVGDALRTVCMGTPPEKRRLKNVLEWLPEPFFKDTIPLAFELQVTPVTNWQYSHFDGCRHHSRNPEHSARELSLFDSFMYACWMGPEYRLPSEQEWEFACRADSPPGQLRWWDDNDDSTKRWIGGGNNASTPDHANSWGIQDQIGDVLEWTSTRLPWQSGDLWDDAVRAKAIPQVGVREAESSQADTQSAFVLRGGAWDYNDPAVLRCGRRSVVQPTVANRSTGCRLSRVARA
jgi:hypothetical protein